MAFGTQDESEEVMAEINMTPLVDVMLVLLIVFIVTVPVMQHAVNVKLPRAAAERVADGPAPLRLSVDAGGRYFLDARPVDDAALPGLLADAAARNPQPQLQIQGDRNARYERVAQAMAAAHRAGLQRIGFVMQPGG